MYSNDIRPKIVLKEIAVSSVHPGSTFTDHRPPFFGHVNVHYSKRLVLVDSLMTSSSGRENFQRPHIRFYFVCLKVQRLKVQRSMFLLFPGQWNTYQELDLERGVMWRLIHQLIWIRDSKNFIHGPS
jgi:hypothetical protein